MIKEKNKAFTVRPRDKEFKDGRGRPIGELVEENELQESEAGIPLKPIFVTPANCGVYEALFGFCYGLGFGLNPPAAIMASDANASASATVIMNMVLAALQINCAGITDCPVPSKRGTVGKPNPIKPFPIRPTLFELAALLNIKWLSVSICYYEIEFGCFAQEKM